MRLYILCFCSGVKFISARIFRNVAHFLWDVSHTDDFDVIV
jgi:hypothetical protein